MLHGSGVVAVVPVQDDWVKEVGEHLRGAATHTRFELVKRKSKDGWPHFAGEIISALFARNQKQLLSCI